MIKGARSEAWDIEPGSTDSRIWTNLALSGQFSGFIIRAVRLLDNYCLRRFLPTRVDDRTLSRHLPISSESKA